jgi:DNA-binding response OmpR family regulator
VETILVAAEASWIRDQVQVAFVEPGQRVIEVHRGQDVRNAISEYEPSVVILDMQIGNMGGVAVALDIRLEQGEGRMPETQILLLLDREADKFLATRCDVDGVLVKPVDAGRLRRAVKNLRDTATLSVAQSAASSLAGLDPAPEAAGTDVEPEPVELASEP